MNRFEDFIEIILLIWLENNSKIMKIHSKDLYFVFKSFMHSELYWKLKINLKKNIEWLISHLLKSYKEYI